MELRNRGLVAAAVALAVLSGCQDPGGSQAADADENKPLALAGNAPGGAAAAATPDFGDDNGDFANDGECDDKRFEGAGMTTTPLLDSDVMHDATDCRTAFEQGRLTVRGEGGTAGAAKALAGTGASAADLSRIQWGDDNGDFANDGECDDMRFEGAGMTTTPLLESDVKHDATDCRTAFQQGRLALRQ